MFENSPKLLVPGALTGEEALAILQAVKLTDWEAGWKRLQDLCPEEATRRALSKCLPTLLLALSEAATPDGSLINFERYAQSVDDRVELFEYLSTHPRAVEILIRLFVGSQFLTEILLKNPTYLEKLTAHKRLADFKSRQQFFQEGESMTRDFSTLPEQLNALRRFQRWELLRIGACDTFQLMDFKSVTLQLSLLADSLVQACLMLVAKKLQTDPSGFVVIAFGKLGGEELNYSSDIDLVFLSQEDAPHYWNLGQNLIKALMDATSEGFLYRVDMRLRPWGNSGSLVNTVEAHLKYLKKHGMLWEKQALLKARPIAGTLEIGYDFLERAYPMIFGTPEDQLRENVQGMKRKIEEGLKKKGRNWGEVKSGEGSIRDVEFITQFLQLKHGAETPEVRSINTLDGLVRCAEFGLLQADEYRLLTSGYVFLRTLEHALQLMHNKQIHTLPEDPRELAYLARRLDFVDIHHFRTYYEQHTVAIRSIYRKYIEQKPQADPAQPPSPRRTAEEVFRFVPSYVQTFDEATIEKHAKMLDRLSSSNVVEVDFQEVEAGEDQQMVPLQAGRHWIVTIAGFDSPGDLSVICGLLFVYGFDIVRGHVFTGDLVASTSEEHSRSASRHREKPKFVDVFTVRPPAQATYPEIWLQYRQELGKLLEQVRTGHSQEAQGELAKRVARALKQVPDPRQVLYPVEIEIDNETSDKHTVLHIHADDTIGFLYELSNALTMAGMDVNRVTVETFGTRVADVLYVTDQESRKITDPNRQQELRSAVVLIKHFTHLLPRSSNPESALLHFRQFLEQMFRKENWHEELTSLAQPDLLDALAQLLGVSDFLWEDFLRLQHDNLFPVLKDIQHLRDSKPRAELEQELQGLLRNCRDCDDQRETINAFKDREMFRIDMRHILGHVEEFGEFSHELTEVAEVVVDAAYRLCAQQLQARFGQPRTVKGEACPLVVCALGKCGGWELGFASDIELMFVYRGSGETSGPEVISTTEYFPRLVEQFTKLIEARREGIFQVDLRLRPYGKAGPLAVSLNVFEEYFSVHGAAWPYERQALVKLRPIAGDFELGEQLIQLRDDLIYTGAPFDVAAMRAMREKQEGQLVKAGTFNAKLSPGGLVDIEYLVQGLQITFGHTSPELRSTNTIEALQALHAHGHLTASELKRLSESYIFLRRLIDALRMVRGHAKDLTVPEPDAEEFEFLARRLGHQTEVSRLQDQLELVTATVREMSRLLDQRRKK